MSGLPAVDFGPAFELVRAAAGASETTPGAGRGIIAHAAKPATADHPLVRTVSNALLSEAARDLDEAPRELRDDRNDMEKALLKHAAILSENTKLKEANARLAAELDSSSRVGAQDVLRLADQVSFLQRQNSTLQEQRDMFSNYAIEMRVRMGNLTKVMGVNASNVEELILTTIDTIEKDMLTRIGTLRSTLLSNAHTAAALIEEASELAKDAAISRLSEARQAT